MRLYVPSLNHGKDRMQKEDLIYVIFGIDQGKRSISGCCNGKNVGTDIPVTCICFRDRSVLWAAQCFQDQNTPYDRKCLY